MDEKGFRKVWERFRAAMEKRGYRKKELEEAKGVTWGDRARVQARMDDKRRAKMTGGGWRRGRSGRQW